MSLFIYNRKWYLSQNRQRWHFGTTYRYNLRPEVASDWRLEILAFCLTMSKRFDAWVHLTFERWCWPRSRNCRSLRPSKEMPMIPDNSWGKSSAAPLPVQFCGSNIKQGYHHNGDQAARWLHILRSICDMLYWHFRQSPTVPPQYQRRTFWPHCPVWGLGEMRESGGRAGR